MSGCSQLLPTAHNRSWAHAHLLIAQNCDWHYFLNLTISIIVVWVYKIYAMSRWAHAHNCSWAHAHLLIKLHCCSIARHYYTARPKGMSCQFCGRHFNRGYNLRRHEQEYCPLRNKKETCIKQTRIVKIGIRKTMSRPLPHSSLEVRRRLAQNLKTKWILGHR